MALKNPSTFFTSIRTTLFGRTISQSQVDGVNSILSACPSVTDYRWVAYELATAFHETAQTMQPIVEYGKGKGHPYGEPTGPYKQTYYGRGLVQLTWLWNYEKAEQKLGDYTQLVQFPDNALKPEIASRIMHDGMSQGWFTGQSLADFFNAKRTDWINARRIINGLDKAAQIGVYAEHFRDALTEGGWA